MFSELVDQISSICYDFINLTPLIQVKILKMSLNHNYVETFHYIFHKIQLFVV